MDLLRNLHPGIIILLFIVALVFTFAIAQEEVKADKALEAITFDRVVLLTLQAVENNYRVREQLFPLVHVDDYYRVILMTAKRLALAELPEKQINPVVKVPKKPEEKSDKKQEKK